MPTINDAINAGMLRDPRWRTHPERAAGGTKYISTFLNRRGDAIAIDLSSGDENAIWTLARLVPETLLPAIRREPYPASKGRNSNLNVRELKGKPLVRLFPATREEALQIVDHFAGL